MLLLREVGALHRAVWFVKISDRMVGEEVLGLHETEVHRISVVVVEHDDIGVCVLSFPSAWSFMCLSLTVLVILIKGVRACDALGGGMFGHCSMFVAHIEKVIGIPCLDNVGVDDVVGLVWSLQLKVGLTGQGIVVVVDICIIDAVLADALASGEVYHQLFAFLIEYRLRSPYASHFSPVHVRLCR